MNATRQQTRRIRSAIKPAWTLAALALASFVLAGCVHAPLARIESVVVRDRYVSSTQESNVRIIRNNAVVAPRTTLRLQIGDSIVTSNTTRMVIEFVAAGYRVTMDTSTTIVIEAAAGDGPSGDAGDHDQPATYLRDGPRGAFFAPRAGGIRPHATTIEVRLAADSVKKVSIFVRLGRAFIEKIRNVSGNLTTETPGVTLHPVGTRYLVSVSAARRTTLSVTEGTVRCVSQSATPEWPPLDVSSGQSTDYSPGTPPRATRSLRQQEIQDMLRWVRDVERVTRIPVPRLDSLTETEARAAVERLGLQLLWVRSRTTGRAAAGRVVEQTPAAGDSVAPGSFVTLMIEKAAQCTVPKITGVSRAVAERLLKGANLVGEGVNDGAELDTVTRQTEAAGTSVACGSVVHYRWGGVR